MYAFPPRPRLPEVSRGTPLQAAWPLLQGSPAWGEGLPAGPWAEPRSHPPCPRPPLREVPGRRPGVGFWRGASVHPGLHSHCAWEARSRGTRPAGSRLCAWWARVVGSGSSMWAVHSGRAGTFVPGPSPGRAIGAIGLCRASGQVGTEASPPGLTLRSLRAPQAPHPRPPETPSSSSLAVSGSGRRSRGAGPSAGWTSDWTSRPWRVVCLRWPWTAQDSASKPSLWPFPLTPPVLVPGQGHGGAGLGPDGGRDTQVGSRGLIRSPGYDVSSGTAGRIAPSPCGSTSCVETGQPQRPPSAHTPRGCRITLLEEGTTYTAPSTAPGSGFPRNALRPRGLSRVFPDQRPPSTPLLTVLTTRLQNRHSRRASHDP